MSFDPASFAQVVFSGGGTRCFWHGGFMSQVGTIATIRPERVCGLSGGALSGAAWISGQDERCKQVMGEIFERNERNLAIEGDGIAPHEQLYREAVEGTLPDTAIATIAEGPAFQIALATPPRGLSSRLFAAICAVGYSLEEKLTGSPRLRFTRWLGLELIRVDARQAARDGRLVDLIVAAATIPPVFDIPRWDGRDVIDAGMATKAAYPDPDAGRTLVLMTSPYRDLPAQDDKLFATPSSPVEADKIDFTGREQIEETWAQGCKDARGFLAEQA
ncbi:patatin-like phospholipase family protein [Sphingomicrobium astaxanthinifaciens]|uniref:patatin-like phospholipase family protein n=1 Tax=Sphingomicrobium astaxanthinifaciens TaxID=1227949 RepID=UPI001FCAC6B1|nr:patatin-like phospholipase family protein [Sphingomicrobium astaxanthinifaciens]MCJ7420720.1 patatin-like phospholipase family protein [Sphingomicrobium astaxanthinifaciens]